MLACVRCGNADIKDAPRCPDCGCPLTLSAWKDFGPPRGLTLDTGCVNARDGDSHLSQLELWAAEGKLTLQRANAMLSELSGDKRVAKARLLAPHPRVFTWNESVWGGPDVLAGPDLEDEIGMLLFPTSKPLTSNQWHDVQHLRQHVRTGGEVFVTRNRTTHPAPRYSTAYTSAIGGTDRSINT